MSLNSCHGQKIAQCVEQDRVALLAFKAGIVEDPSGALKSWTGNDCCKWKGVSCDNNGGRVVSLILDGDPMGAGNTSVYMSGSISESIGNLSYLRTFTLMRWKNIGGIIPASISRLSALNHLTLDNNKLTGSIPSDIGQLLSLQSLSLTGNLIAGPIPESIGKLRNLTSLYLDSNRLSGFIPSSIGNLRLLSVFVGNFW